MSCHDFAAALLDERMAPPAGLQEHVAHCPECRALAGLHASASALRMVEPAAPAPITTEAILGEVRRRQRRRRQGAVLGAAAAVGLLLLLLPGRVRLPDTGGDSAASAGVAVEGSARILPESSSPSEAPVGQEVASLGELLAEVRGYTRTRPAFADTVYRPFGRLASWVRPPESTALDAEPFQTALAAFALSRSPAVVE